MAAGDGHRSLVNLYLEPLPPTPIPASGMTAPPPIPSPPTFKTPPLEEIPYFLKPKPSPPYVSAAGVAADRTTPAIDTPAPTKPHLGPMSLSVRALQYLPIPLLVLSDRKTVILANEAMGRFLRVPPPMLNNTSRNGGSAYPQTGTTEVLLGMSLNDLAVDVFEEDATLCLVAWDLVLASLTEDEDGIEMLDDGSPARLRDTTMEVHVPYFGSTPKWRSGPEGPVRRSQMTVSPWRGDDGEVYFTLTFKSAPSERQTTLELPFDMDELNSDTTVHRPAPGMSEKITVLKEALIDVMEIPVFAMWADGSVMVPNRAGFELTHPPEPGEAGKKAFNRNDFMANLRIFTEGFERELSVDESPLVRIVNTQQPFDSMMVGMFAGGHRRLIDVGGKCVYDKHGEFVGALISMRDVTKITEMQKILDTEGQRNEVMFRDMLDSIPQMIWTTTSSGKHDYFSKRWYDYTGLSPENCLGSVCHHSHLALLPGSRGLTKEERKGWKIGHHRDDLSTINAKWKHSLDTGDPYNVEFRCRRYDGEYRWMLGRALPLRDPNTGEITKWYGTTTDIHDMVEARTAERATRAQLSEALTHAELTLWAVDRNRRFTMLEGMGDFIGGIIWQTRDNPEYYLGKDAKIVLDEVNPNDKYHAQFIEPIDPLLRGEISEGFSETELDGHWFKTKYVPVRGLKGPGGEFDPNYVTGIIGLSMDLTKMHATELELQERESQNRILQANEQAAKEASTLKSEFLASMSHEIRTPIAGVCGMCEILLDTELSSEQREFAEGIQRSANALLICINDILDLSKVESGKMDIEEVQFNLSLVIRDVVKMLSFEAERKKLQFAHDIDFPGTEDLTVMGDPGRVRQILGNLLSNAVKFTHEGSVELKASVEEDSQDTITIHFVVNDTGIGIKDSDQGKLFQPFTQADSSTARKFGGTGLGLTICQNLVTLMGGSIGLSSSAGVGTAAHFTVPFKKAQSGSFMNLDIESIPERLQSDTSVSCWASNSGTTGTTTPPPESPSVSGDLHRQTSLMHRLNRSMLAGVDSALLSNPEERRKRHILVVEDNEINQQIAIRLIEKMNFTVSAVRNGLECLDFVRDSTLLPPSDDERYANPPRLRRPDIILMDVQMPEMDGYSATRAIRAGKLTHSKSPPTSESHAPLTAASWLLHPSLRPVNSADITATAGALDWLGSVPIVAMTASAIKGDREKCRDAGMDDYLAKPVRGGMLEKMLLKWCSNNRGNANLEEDPMGLSPIAGSRPQSASVTPGACSDGVLSSAGTLIGDEELVVTKGTEEVSRAMDAVGKVLLRNIDGAKKGVALNSVGRGKPEIGKS